MKIGPQNQMPPGVKAEAQEARRKRKVILSYRHTIANRNMREAAKTLVNMKRCMAFSDIQALIKDSKK